MSNKYYLNEELVEIELREWFNNEYRTGMPVLEIIQNIENILRNMKSEIIDRDKKYIEKAPLIAWLENMNVSEYIINSVKSDVKFPPANVKEIVKIE